MNRDRDEAMMRRAIGLARPHLGRTWPNPVVGCVIARGEQVLAQAVTADGGRPHAEEQALAGLGEAARGADVYVTLEPCGQRSNGADSCSQRLTHAGVARVLIAADNPDPLSAGRGLARLEAAGVPVEMGFLADEAQPLYRAFRYKLRTGMPLVQAATEGESFDARFEPLPREPLQAALARYGEAGYVSLWVEADGALAVQLEQAGLLA